MGAVSRRWGSVSGTLNGICGDGNGESRNVVKVIAIRGVVPGTIDLEDNPCRSRESWECFLHQSRPASVSHEGVSQSLDHRTLVTCQGRERSQKLLYLHATEREQCVYWRGQTPHSILPPRMTAPRWSNRAELIQQGAGLELEVIRSIRDLVLEGLTDPRMIAWTTWFRSDMKLSSSPLS